MALLLPARLHLDELGLDDEAADDEFALLSEEQLQPVRMVSLFMNK